MTPQRESASIRKLYWASFGMRYGFGLLAWILTVEFGLPVMEDASDYSRLGAEMAQDWLAGKESIWLSQAIERGTQPWFMVVVLACFYCMTGGNEALPIALAGYCLLTSLTPVLAYRCGKRLGVPADGAMFGARLIAFSPAFAIWSGALYKEGFILIALYLIIDHALRLQEQFRPASVLVLCGTLAALFGLRFYIGIIMSVTLLIGLLFGRGNRKSGDGFSTVIRQVIVLLFLVSAFGLLGVGDTVEKFVHLDVEKNLQQMDSSRKDLASYNSGYLRETDIRTVDAALKFGPVGVAYFMTVPLPWQIGSWRQNTTIVETLFWIVFVYPRALRGIRFGSWVRPQGVLFLVLAALAIAGLYGLFVGNIGTAYRLRIQVWAILALLAGWGYASSRVQHKVRPNHQRPGNSFSAAQGQRSSPNVSIRS